jgi:hypothetical protein
VSEPPRPSVVMSRVSRLNPGILRR